MRYKHILEKYKDSNVLVFNWSAKSIHRLAKAFVFKEFDKFLFREKSPETIT
jgi:hypothetical protein